MRIRRPIGTPFAFGIQSLLGLVAASAFIIFCGEFYALIAIGSIAVHYAALSLTSFYVANLHPVPTTPPYRNWNFNTGSDGTTLRIAAAIYIIFHYVWHMFWLMVTLPIGYQMIWHTPSLGPLTLAHVEHLGLAAFSLLLIASYLSRSYAGVQFSRRICVETSTLLTFLLATHIAIP